MAQRTTTATLEAQKIWSDECCRKGEHQSVCACVVCVRIKLAISERGKLRGKKMAPVFSDVYIVKPVVNGRGDTEEQGVYRTKQPEAVVPVPKRRKKREAKYVIPQQTESRYKETCYGLVQKVMRRKKGAAEC